MLKERGEEKPGMESEEKLVWTLEETPINSSITEATGEEILKKKEGESQRQRDVSKISTKNYPLNLLVRMFVNEVLSDKNPNQMGSSKTSIIHMADTSRSSVRSLNNLINIVTTFPSPAFLYVDFMSLPTEKKLALSSLAS